MSKVIIDESVFSGIAAAIRSKLGVQTAYKPSQMAAAIQSIAPQPVLETKSIVANGTYTPASGKDGFSEVTVNVPNSYAAGDEGKVVSSGALVAQTARASTITANGTYDTTNNNSVTVNVSGGGGMPGEVLFSQYKGQDSGSTQTISTSYTVTTAGYYYLSSGGWLDAVSLKVNDVELELTSFANYSKFRSGIVQLAVNDVITINTYGSGRLAIHGLIIFLHS